MALVEQVTVQATAQFELHDTQEASSRFPDLWKSASEQDEATKRYLAQFAQQPTAAQAKLAHKTLRSRAFEAAILNSRDVVAKQR